MYLDNIDAKEAILRKGDFVHVFAIFFNDDLFVH